jgi:hypothetical protein
MNELMLTNDFINSFTNDKNASHTKQDNQDKIKKLRNTTSENKTDHLFWYIYNIIYPNNIVKNKFLEEKQIKFKWMEMINSDKNLCKKYKNIQPFLITHNNINLESADAACHLFNISLIIIYENTYVYLNKSDITPIIIKYVNNNYTKINESYDYISNKYFYVDNYNKLCYSISHYKSVELKDIAVKLGIDIPIKHKKNDIYEDIKNKLKLIYLKI